MHKQFHHSDISSAGLRRAFIGLLIFGMGGSSVFGEILTPSNVFLTSYNAAVLNGVAVANNRANAFTILTNGVIQQTAFSDRIDTWNADDANTSPDHTAYDFVGLQYDGPKRFDSITIHLSPQFGDGGDWETAPKVYILKNPTLVGGEVEPNISPSWVELVGTPAPTGHTFNPIAQAYGSTGGSFTYDLTSLADDLRTGWGWAVGGVDGNQRSSDNNWNFIGLTEVLAEGVDAPVPQKVTANTLRPTNIVSNSYHSPGFGGDGFIDGRGLAFKSITNGIINNASFDEGFDTWQGDGAGTITDFVGLHYATLNVFDSVTIELASQFNDGGDWDAKPKVYILKNPVDTNLTPPESDPDNWLELDAPETTGHVFSPLVAAGDGGRFTLDLSGFTQEQRTGWGIAVGGVDGNSNASGVVNFVSVSEMLVAGTVIPGPYDLSLQVNTTTGEVKIMNNTNLDLDLDFYEISSPAGSLDVTTSGWNSLQNPTLNTPAFPSGDGSGNGWEVVGTPDANSVTEFYLQGTTEMLDGTSVSLGNLFAGGTQDLFFRYGINGAYVDGVVEYISDPTILGDTDSDGDIDLQDLLNVQNNFGLPSPPALGDTDGDGDVDLQDLLNVQNNFGLDPNPGALATAPSAVPEPTSLLLVGLTAVGALWAVRRRR